VSFRVVDIDHLMIRVASLERGVEVFRDLGFTVAPPRRLVDMSALEGAVGGSGAGTTTAVAKSTINNRHILFQPFPGREDTANFLELMAIEDQLNTPPHVTQMLCFLLDSEGPRTVVTLADDLDRALEEMRGDGIETSTPIAWETGWDDEETGNFIRVAGRPAVPVYGQTPFMVNPCEHGIVESMRHEPWTRHPNGARYFAGVTGVSERIDEHVALMAERVYGVEPEWESDDIAIIRPRDLFFRVVTPAGFAQLYPDLDYSTERVLPAYCGATIAVESLDVVRKTLDAHGVDHVQTPRGGLAVPRHRAANTIIEFVHAD
jgi:Glyoxalase-like domain